MDANQAKIEPAHGGCIVCSSKDEPVLSSGARPGKNIMPESVAVCSNPECRKGVTFTGNP